MKTKSTFAALLLCVFALVFSAHSQGTNLTALLQQGLLEEQANRNLDKAIADYQMLATQFDQDRQLAATAVFRLGECYRAQGKTNDAAAQYERVLKDFSDQTTLAALSRQNLVGMGTFVKDPGTNENPDAKLWGKLKDLPRSEVEKLLPTLVPDAVLDQLLQSRNETEAKLAQLKVDYAPDNLNVVRQQTALNEINRQIGEKIDGMLQGLKLRAELFTPQSANDARRQQKELLAKQITLAEQDLADTQKLFQVGKATQAEVRAAEREELRLRQQLVALDSVRTDLSNLASPVSSEEDQEIARIQQMIQNSPDLINAANGGNTPLGNAAAHGWLKVAAFLLDHGADVNASYDTALFSATKAGNRAMVELLLSRGANVNANKADTANNTPLHIAVQNGFPAVVEVLLANNADVNAPTRVGGYTPLFLAAQNNNPKIAATLLEHKADVDIQDQSGRSPLSEAARLNSPEIVKLLLAAGTNPNTENKDGRTPLSYAAGNGLPEMVKMLLAAKADPNGGKFDVPLLCAIHKNDFVVAEMLLQAGANPNAKGAVDWTVDGAVSNVQFVNNPKGYSLTTPLYLAISMKQFPMVQLLLKFKADQNDSQTDGRPLLFDTLSDTNILEALLAAGANIESHDTTVNVNGDRPDWTPLTAAVWEKNTNAVEILLKHGANPNQRDAVGNVALHWTVSYLWGQLTDQNYRAAELLLAHGADPNVRNKDGYTPLDWVKRRLGSKESSSDKVVAAKLADLLRQHGALDKLPVWDRITVSRPSANYSEAVFVKGTNDWNRFSLFELIAVHYGLVSANLQIRLPEQKLEPFNGMLVGSLQFPNLERVIIHRPSSAGTWQDIKVDLGAKLKSGDCSQDVSLKWGDEVEIPESDHPVVANWSGLPSDDQATLRNCLKRQVQLTVKDTTTNIVLEAYTHGTTITYGAYGKIVATLPQFDLAPVLDNSGLIRASSDLSRVKVTRHEPGEISREWILNCSNQKNSPDFWLRNGDVIEVPEMP